MNIYRGKKEDNGERERERDEKEDNTREEETTVKKIKDTESRESFVPFSSWQIFCLRPRRCPLLFFLSLSLSLLLLFLVSFSTGCECAWMRADDEFIVNRREVKYLPRIVESQMVHVALGKNRKRIWPR